MGIARAIVIRDHACEDAGWGSCECGGVDVVASSIASHEASNSSRCRGSIARASRGLMPKEGGVELGYVVQEAALACVAGPGVIGVGVI